MGNCSSISSPGIHDDAYGQENAVYFAGSSGNESQRVGSVYSHAGSKGLNQDCALLVQGYGVEDGTFCAVFDGHGKNGHIVSKIVRNRLPSLLLSQRNSFAKLGSDGKNFMRWRDACMTAFKAVDRELKFLATLDCSCSGTTTTIVIKQGEDLIIANLGDTRAVLGTRTESGIMAVQLTTDLKPHDDSPGLAMSRAFGDFVLKNNGIICTPDVSYRRVAPEDAFLVVASDGVWDVLSNEEVVSIVATADSEEGAAKAVVDAAAASWKHKFPNSKRDDCTVICQFLQYK